MMDRLLTETSRVSLSKRARETKPARIPKAESIMEQTAMDMTTGEESTAEINTAKLRQLQNTLDQALDWLREFETKRRDILPRDILGDDAVKEIASEIKALCEEIHENTVLDVAKNEWYKLLPILMKMTVLSRDLLNRSNLITANLTEWTNTVTSTLELLFEQAKCLHVQPISQPLERHVEEVSRLDPSQLEFVDYEEFTNKAISIGRDGLQNDPLCLSKIQTVRFMLQGLMEN